MPLPYLFLNRAVRRATGGSATAAWAAWQGALAAGANPGVTGAAPVAGVRGLRTLVAPRVSPDGARILFVLDDGREGRGSRCSSAGAARCGPSPA